MRQHVLWVALLAVGCAEPQKGGGVDLGTGAPDLQTAKGGFWQECTNASQCASDVCYKQNPTDAIGRCTQPCTRECPDGFACKTVRIDVMTELDLCIPAVDTFCKRCSTHRDCGDSSDLCLDIGAERFCGIDCRGNPGVCPPGFECRKLGQVAEWLGVEQCMPVDNVCCIDADKDGRGKGDGCIAGDCNDHDARIYDDAVDICDGIDNNCKNGVDETPVNCAKAECQLGQFGYYERAAQPCTGGMCAMQSAKDCGLYTCVDGGEMGDTCATTCDGEIDLKCVPTAHCEAGTCVADLPDGQACNEDSDCQSSHCQNGFCCASGDCCAQPSDCPTVGLVQPSCDDPATCQGTKGAITCVSFRCGALNGVPDDSACTTSVEANACGFYKSIFCSGALSQSAPACPTSCNTHADCDANGHCDPSSKTCVEDLDDGRACGSDAARCKSGHCQNGFCCASGDCCAAESDCPGSYSTAPVCTTPTACQGKRDVARCEQYRCSTQQNVDDDSACGGAVLANDCGPYVPIYCNGQPLQTPPVCPGSCNNNLDCDQNAYCNASSVCVPDEVNGRPCGNDDQCQSGHCQNGYCCASGDCCASNGDCGAYNVAAVCTSQVSCQGNRVDGVCSAAKQCGSTPVDDDSACAGLLANDCGPYPTVHCTGQQNQPSGQAGLCATGCMGDAECDVSAHCDGGVCVPDQGPGGFCDEPSDCGAGLFCVDSVCCNSACNGTCQACDLPGSVGTCTNVPNGQDPDGECPGVACTSYYWGWLGDWCYRKADVSAASASCNGAGACRTAAQECSAQTTRSSSVQVTCDSYCQDPRGGTCAGTTAGACDNVSQGNHSCGNGVCRVTVPQCVSGRFNTCVPNWAAQSTETCNNVDDNCDGTVDNGSFADPWPRETNNSCTTYYTLPSVGSNQSRTESMTLYPSGDVDYFRINASESDSDCACGFPWVDEDYEMTVTLEVPAGAGSYIFCINRDDCNGVGNNCQTVWAGGSAWWKYQMDGGCPGNDNYTFYVRVAPGNNPGYECAAYKLTYFFDAGFCR